MSKYRILINSLFFDLETATVANSQRYQSIIIIIIIIIIKMIIKITIISEWQKKKKKKKMKILMEWLVMTLFAKAYLLIYKG